MHMVILRGTIQRGGNRTNTLGDSTLDGNMVEVTIANCVSRYVLNHMERGAS